MPYKHCRQVNPQYINDAQYCRRSSGCIVLNRDNQLLLQYRDSNAPTSPNCIGTFGGGIEKGETPLEALIRELKEELGAVATPDSIIQLGAVAEPESNYQSLVYMYFWHDVQGSITGCYEGEARYFNYPDSIQKHQHVAADVVWAIKECNKRRLLHIMRNHQDL